MAAPRKKLTDLVDDRSFLARRHAERLLEEPLRRADLRQLQEAFRTAATDEARAAIARAFEAAVRSTPPEVELTADQSFYCDLGPSGGFSRGHTGAVRF